jgi:hypothetical protein
MYRTDNAFRRDHYQSMGTPRNYAPETLNLLQEVLDQVWTAPPIEQSADIARPEMAQRIVRRKAKEIPSI